MIHMSVSAAKNWKIHRRLDLAQTRDNTCQERKRYLRFLLLDFSKAFSLKGNQDNPLRTLQEDNGGIDDASGAGNGNKKLLSVTIASNISGMEEKIITIVFWDIRGFSALCYSLEVNPILLTQFLKEFFDATTQIILKHGGVVDKFLGDGVMALFGAQSRMHCSVGNSAICAVSAALELREQFIILKKKWTEIWQRFVPSQINIGLKCGINTGYASVGKLGAKKYDYFTAFGVNVNLANRLVNLSDDNEIVVSITTKSKIFEQFELRRRGAVSTLKNIPGSFEVFSVIRKKSPQPSALRF
jgi:class 3 adenylate cyclase